MRRDCVAFAIGPVFGGTSGVAASPEASRDTSRYAPAAPVNAQPAPLSWDERVARYLARTAR